MNRLLIAMAALFAGPAMAADLPVRAVPVVPLAPPVPAWTGLYAGFNGGYSWGRSNTGLTLLDGATGSPLASAYEKLSLKGGVFGGQIGYNWQYGIYVFGFETDIQWSDEKDSTSVACNTGACLPTAVIPGGASSSRVTFDQKIDWFGTLRGRLGMLAGPNVLLYGTGGLAYGGVKSDLAVWGFNSGGQAISLAESHHQVHVGWTAGAGIEGRLGGNWTGKLEYLYMNLGSFSGTSAVLAAGPPTLQGSYNSRVHDNIFRVGINYKFGGPVVARY